MYFTQYGTILLSLASPMEPLEAALGKLSLEPRTALKAQFGASNIDLSGQVRPNFNRVCFNPEYMKKMNLSSLSPIIVSNQGENEVCALAWPSLNVAPDCKVLCVFDISINCELAILISAELRRVVPVAELGPLYWANLDVSKTKSPESVSICHKDLLEEHERKNIQEFLLALKYVKAGMHFLFPSEFSLQIPGGTGYALLTRKCQFIFKKSTSDEQTGAFYVNCPGQSRVKDELRSLYESRSSSSSLRLKELKIRPPKGAIIHGPAGVGKTTLAKRFCEELGVFTVHIDGTDLGSKYFGESEKKVLSYPSCS